MCSKVIVLSRVLSILATGQSTGIAAVSISNLQLPNCQFPILFMLIVYRICTGLDCHNFGLVVAAK